jgi:hypothetical protein
MICFALPLCFGTIVLNCPITTFGVICQTLIKSTYLILSISSFKKVEYPSIKAIFLLSIAIIIKLGGTAMNNKHIEKE